MKHQVKLLGEGLLPREEDCLTMIERAQFSLNKVEAHFGSSKGFSSLSMDLANVTIAVKNLVAHVGYAHRQARYII